MLVNLNEVLKPAMQNHYGVGLFNTTDSDMLDAVIMAAEELRAPVIIGTAEVLLPYGEMELLAPAMVAAAKRASVPVVVHYDHGLTFGRCMQALRLGFSSIMYDGSSGDAEANIRETAEIVRIAHAFGATVEGEIGHVGEASRNDNEVSDQYTTPEEAFAFVDATGVDALAIAIGTAHGAYKTKPCLDVERLKAIRSKVSIPLVLHGGSGLSDEDFRSTVRHGISKVNIYTDLCQASVRGTQCALEEGLNPMDMYCYHNMRTRRVEAICETVKRKMSVFGCVGKV